MIRQQIRILLVISCLLVGAGAAEAGLKIYYIRHAEGGHNVKADWEFRKVPEDQWPDYVGDADMFTPKGLVQQAAVASKLNAIEFDFIAASSAWRSRNTILPYLQEAGVKSEVWPELYEIRAGKLILAEDLPVPSEPILGVGDPVELPDTETDHLFLRKGGERAFKVPRIGHTTEDERRSNAAARVVIQKVLDLIQERFGGTDATLLLSGHGSSGKAVLRMLTKNPLKGFPGISNTGIWMVEEQANGEFELMLFNDEPVVDGKPSVVSRHAALDINGDGQVTKAEYVDQRAAGFGRVDDNDDGFISEDELGHSSFEDADKNQDNRLSSEEYTSIFEDQFDRFYDKNGDGILTLKEMR